MSATQTPTADYARALAHFKAGQYAEALPLLQQQAQRAPEERTLYGIAMCHVRLGDWKAAEQALVELVERHPQQASYAEELAAVRRQLRGNTRDVDPAALGTDTSGAAPTTLAALLEREDVDWGLQDFTGDLLLSRGRSLLSHRRLWLAAALVLVLPLLGWLEGAVRDAADLLPSADARSVAADAVGVLQSLTLIVLLVAIGMVVFALLSSRLTRYVVWAHRIDITTGVLLRRHRTVWLYKLTDVQLVQNPVLLLAGTAALVLYVDETSPTTKRPPRLVGLGTSRSMRRLQDQLLYLTAQERRGMKKQFI